MDVHLVIPSGSCGLIERDLWVLSAIINTLGLGGTDGGALGGLHDSGAQFNCEVFMMHPHCWCGRQDCPWCCRCTCPESTLHYSGEERGRKKKELRKRMQVVHEPVCEFCTTSLFPEYGTEPGRPAPNFWYKPTDFKVWWYKYIGRDMEYNRKVRVKEWNAIFRHCLEAVVEAADRRVVGR